MSLFNIIAIVLLICVSLYSVMLVIAEMMSTGGHIEFPRAEHHNGKIFSLSYISNFVNYILSRTLGPITVMLLSCSILIVCLPFLVVRELLAFLKNPKRALNEIHFLISNTIKNRISANKPKNEKVIERSEIDDTKHNVNKIIYAAYRGDMQSFSTLINMGVDVNMANEDGITALHYSALKGNVNMVRVLIDKGADFSLSGNKSSEALIIENRDDVKELISQLTIERAATEAANEAVKALYLKGLGEIKSTQITTRAL